MTLDQYLGRKISEITWGRSIDKFISAEQYTLQKYNLSLIDYLVIYHNEKNRSLRDFEKELGIDGQSLAKVFNNFSLPRPSRIESMTNKWQDPVEGPKLAQSVSDRYKDPEYMAKMKKALEEVRTKPGYHEKQTKMMKDRWADKEYYNRVMPKIQTSLHNKWQNDSQYRENVIEGGKKFNQNPELRKKTNEKLSELGKARCAADPKYAEMSRKQMKKNWQDPEFREMMLNFLKERGQNPEYIERMRQKTTENWQDPKFREKTISGLKRKWEEPEYREKMEKILKSPEVRTRLSEALVKRWQNPEFKSYMSKLMSDIITLKWTDPITRKVYEDASKKLWQDQDFRKRFKKIMQNKWENDKGYREKITDMMVARWADSNSREELLNSLREGIREFWADPERVAKKLEKITPEQRKMKAEIMAQISNRLWSDPQHREKIVNSDRRRWRRRGYEDSRNEYLPTNSGFRRDIGFNAKSCWEANIARILLFCGREFTRNFPLEITIEQEYEDIFEPGNSTFFVDFISDNKKGSSKVYEIIAHYLENPIGIAKADMLLHQYPNMPIKIIDQKTYKRLQNHFKDRINEDPRFVGWEETGYNIKTNPEDFS